jgi:hypothetical protein
MDSFPEIRISRQVQLIPGQSSAFFLTITNNTSYTMELKLIGQKCDADAHFVDVSFLHLSQMRNTFKNQASKFSMEMIIPSKDNSADNNPPGMEYAADPNE